MNSSTRAHLCRLSDVWVKNPIYFVTICTAGRRRILDRDETAKAVRGALADSDRIHGWVVGRFVIMPDHVHFFARPRSEAKLLSAFVRDWKRWTASQVGPALGQSGGIWQKEFFDHVLRSAASYAEKWEYVKENPVRAGLVTVSTNWPHQGEIETLTF
jgi:REP element-mobilizing transposase RayT